jgi:hypothetical protein
MSVWKRWPWSAPLIALALTAGSGCAIVGAAVGAAAGVAGTAVGVAGAAVGAGLGVAGAGVGAAAAVTGCGVGAVASAVRSCACGVDHEDCSARDAVVEEAPTASGEATDRGGWTRI